MIRAGFGLFYDAFPQDVLLGHLPYPGRFMLPVRHTATLDADPITSAVLNPNSTDHHPGVPGLLARLRPIASSIECDIFAVDPHIKTPYMENYNINIQQQITNKTTLQVAYVGSQGHRLFRFYDINQPTQAADYWADCPSGIATCAPLRFIQDFTVPRPFGNAGVGAFYIFQEKSTGAVELQLAAGQLQGQRLARHHFSAQLCVFEVTGQLERPRRLRAERGAAAGQQQPTKRIRTVKLQHPTAPDLGVQLRTTGPGREHAAAQERLGLR